MTEAEMYREAAAILRRDGWCRIHLTDEKGRHCLFGALQKSNAVLDATKLYEIIGAWNAMIFNDTECSSADDAIAILEIAADLATPSP